MSSKSLIKNASIVAAGNFFRLLAKSILSFVLARILTKEDNGSYRQLLLIYNTFAVFFLLGLPSSILYFLPQKRTFQEQKQFISQTFSVIGFLGLLLSGTIFFSRSFLATRWNNPELEHILKYFAIFPFFMFFGEAYNFFMLGLKKAKNIAWFSIFSIITDLIFILGFSLVWKNAIYTSFGLITAVFLQACFVLFHLRKYIGRSQFDFILLKQQIQYSAPIWVSTFILYFGKQFDKIVISDAFDPAIYAVFAIGATEIPLVGNIRNSIFNVLLPELSSLDFDKERERVYDLYRGSIRKIALIFYPLATFFFVFGMDFITILFSAKYTEALPIFRIYLILLPLRIANYTMVMQVANRTKILFYRSLVVLVLNIGANLLFIKMFGIFGPAWATVIVTYLDVIGFLILFKTVLKLKISKLFPIVPLIKNGLVAILSAIIVYPFSLLSINSFVRFFGGFGIFSIVYFILGRLTKTIQDYEIELIKEVVSKKFRKK